MDKSIQFLISNDIRILRTMIHLAGNLVQQDEEEEAKINSPSQSQKKAAKKVKPRISANPTECQIMPESLLFFLWCARILNYSRQPGTESRHQNVSLFIFLFFFSGQARSSHKRLEKANQRQLIF